MGERDLVFDIRHDPFVQMIRASGEKDTSTRLTRYVAWAHQIGFDEAEKILKRMEMF